MAQRPDVEDGIKSTLKIGGENYYLTVGEAFAMVTVPRENDDRMSETRMIAESICTEITRSLEVLQERREKKLSEVVGND